MQARLARIDSPETIHLWLDSVKQTRPQVVGLFGLEKIENAATDFLYSQFWAHMFDYIKLSKI